MVTSKKEASETELQEAMMPVQRDLWVGKFTDDGQPAWPCPRCGLGSLRLKEGTLATMQKAESRQMDEVYGSYVANSEGKFTCLMVCGSRPCGEPVAVAGDFYLTEPTGPKGPIEAVYTPAFFSPAPALIRVPRDYPDQIRREVMAAFRLSWCDLGSCLNRIRTAIELLLNDMKVRRYGKKTDGGRFRLPLDARINVLRSKRPDLAGLCDRLLAVKHLGNAGSHPGEVHREDVFDGFDILEHVLLERYENPHGQLARVVKEINRRKGPRKAGA
jgi:hypothetical protein